MGKAIRYTDELKQEAVNQVVGPGYSILDASKRLGITNKNLYVWIKVFSKPKRQQQEDSDLRAEITRLKRELRRSEQERTILKEAAVFFACESKNAAVT